MSDTSGGVPYLDELLSTGVSILAGSNMLINSTNNSNGLVLICNNYVENSISNVLTTLLSTKGFIYEKYFNNSFFFLL